VGFQKPIELVFEGMFQAKRKDSKCLAMGGREARPRRSAAGV